MTQQPKSGKETGARGIGRRGFLGSAAGAAVLLAGNASAQGTVYAGSIDCHAHWSPAVYRKALSEAKPRPGATAPPRGGNRNPLDFDLEKRIAWMDAHGVAMHVLTISGQMPWEWVRPEDGEHLAQIVNDAAVEAHAKYPARFFAGIEMDIRDPEAALRELNRVAGKPGMRAVHLPNSLQNQDYLFEPAYEPLLARCEELGYPLLFHPLDGDANIYGGKDRIGNALAASANLSNTLGFPFESATTAAKFIVAGTLDKYPKLEIVLPHSGGCFPYIAGRIERGLVARKFRTQRPFREYIRRFHYDTLAFYPETLRFLISLAGADRVVIGTDNYAAMDVQQPNALVEELRLPEKDQGLIFRGNAARLLKI
ncbi:MAG TPA: amidohydrolase family protein [Bryobacteraceae bacterium]|nr:amidohydrolase family protein [Bryobacteraceae bacterium]